MSAASHHITWIVDGHKEKGVCLTDDGKRYTMQTAHGLMSFAHGDGTVEVGDLVSTCAYALPVPVGGWPTAKAAPAQGSKKAQAIALYEKLAATKLTRKEIIAVFVDKLGMTPAGASTYYAMAQSYLISQP